MRTEDTDDKLESCIEELPGTVLETLPPYISISLLQSPCMHYKKTFQHTHTEYCKVYQNKIFNTQYGKSSTYMCSTEST